MDKNVVRDPETCNREVASTKSDNRNAVAKALAFTLACSQQTFNGGQVRPLAKYIDGVNTPEAIRPPYLVTLQREAVDTLDELSEVLRELEGMQDVCMIRAAPAPGVEPDMVVRRLGHDDAITGDKATVVDAPSRLLVVDFDSVDCEVDVVREPLQAAEHLRALMPPEFRGAKVVFRASSSVGFKRGICGWLLFESDVAVTNAQLKHWLKGFVKDLSIYNVTQPLFTARPIFAEGVPDPMSERVFLLDGEQRVVVPQHIRAFVSPQRQAPRGGEFWAPATRSALAKWQRGQWDEYVPADRFNCPACGGAKSAAVTDSGAILCRAAGHDERAPGVGTETGDGSRVFSLFEGVHRILSEHAHEHVEAKLIELGLMRDWRARWTGLTKQLTKRAADPERNAAAVKLAVNAHKAAIRQIKASPQQLGVITEAHLQAHYDHVTVPTMRCDFANAAVFHGTGRAGGFPNLAEAEAVVDDAIRRVEARRAGAPANDNNPDDETNHDDETNDGDGDVELELPAEALELTEAGLSLQLAHRARHAIRYVPGVGWHSYDGKCWVRLERGKRPTDVVSQLLNVLAEQLDDPELAKLLKSKQTRKSLESIAALAEPHMSAATGELDADPMLLNCQNGTLDLRTGKLRRHTPDDLITMITSVDYDPNATCPQWLQALDTYACGAAGWVGWHQHWLGYSATGNIECEQVVFFEGTGGNGKSTVMSTVAAVLGTYAGTLPAIAVENADAHSSSIGGLGRVRFMRTAEIDSRKPLATARLRAITSYEALRAQPGMGQDFVEFVPRAKLTMSINGIPRILDAGRSMQRRLRVVPYSYEIPLDQVGSAGAVRLDQTLVREEGPGILAWLVEGARAMAARGWQLPQCDAITEASKDIFAANASLADWIDDACTVENTASGSLADLFGSYLRWAENERVPARDVLTKHAFGAKLTELGYLAAKGAKGRRTYALAGPHLPLSVRDGAAFVPQQEATNERRKGNGQISGHENAPALEA